MSKVYLVGVAKEVTSSRTSFPWVRVLVVADGFEKAKDICKVTLDEDGPSRRGQYYFVQERGVGSAHMRTWRLSNDGSWSEIDL